MYRSLRIRFICDLLLQYTNVLITTYTNVSRFVLYILQSSHSWIIFYQSFNYMLRCIDLYYLYSCLNEIVGKNYIHMYVNCTSL